MNALDKAIKRQEAALLKTQSIQVIYYCNDREYGFDIGYTDIILLPNRPYEQVHGAALSVPEFMIMTNLKGISQVTGEAVEWTREQFTKLWFSWYKASETSFTHYYFCPSRADASKTSGSFEGGSLQRWFGTVFKYTYTPEI